MKSFPVCVSAIFCGEIYQYSIYIINTAASKKCKLVSVLFGRDAQVFLNFYMKDIYMLAWLIYNEEVSCVLKTHNIY